MVQDGRIQSLRQAIEAFRVHRDDPDSAELEAAIQRSVSIIVDVLGMDDHLVSKLQSLKRPDVRYATWFTSGRAVHQQAMNRLQGVLEVGLDRVAERLGGPTPMGPEDVAECQASLADSGFDTAVRHYAQAVDSYADERWEACNGQLRTALEAFLCALAARLLDRSTDDPRAATTHLRNAGVIDGNEARLVEGLVGIGNDRGAHPGASSPSEAKFRLAVTTATITHVLRRAYRS